MGPEKNDADIRSAYGDSTRPAVSLAALLPVLGANIFIFIGLFSLAPILPRLESDFAATPHVKVLVPLIGGVGGFAFALGCLAISGMLARLGIRRVFIGSLLALAAASLVSILVPDLIVLVAMRAVIGLGTAGVLNVSMVAIGELLPRERQPWALGLSGLIGGLAAVVGFPLVGLFAAVSYRFGLGLGLVALLFIPFVLTLPSKPTAVSAAPPVPVRVGSVGWAVIVGAIFAGMVSYIGAIFGPLYLSELGFRDPAVLSLPSTTAAIGTTLGSMVFVFIKARFGLRAVFVFCMLMIAVGLLTVGISSTVWGVSAGTFLAVVGTGTWFPAINAAAIEAAPQNPGPVLGFCNSIYFGSMILFPLIAVPLAQRLGGSKDVVLIYSGLALLMVLPFLQARSAARKVALAK